MSDSTYSTTRRSLTGADDAAGSQCGRPDELLTLLSRIVRRDIVPKLIVANRIIGEDSAARQAGAAAAWHDGGFNAERGDRDVKFVSNHVRMADVARFVRLLRSTGVDAAPALVEVLLSRGICRSELYLDLLGPAARMIGDMWADDECSFADVTMVVGRLHNILHALRTDRTTQGTLRNAPGILLSVAPGEQHCFGIAIADAVFQDAGWSTTLSHTNDADVLLQQIATQRFDAIGLSLSYDGFKDVLRATIMRARSVSANRDLVVFVGGPAFSARPELATELGADGLVGAGLEAAIKARDVLPRQALYA